MCKKQKLGLVGRPRLEQTVIDQVVPKILLLYNCR